MNIPVYIPDVDHLPVLRAEWGEITEQEFKRLLSDDLVVRCDDYGFSNYTNIISDPEGYRLIEMQVNRVWSDLPIVTLSEKTSEDFNRKIDMFDKTTVYASKQEMSLQGAIKWTEDTYRSIYKKFNGSIFVDNIMVFSPYYYNDTYDEYPFGDLTGIGCYAIQGYQALRGVPIFDSIVYGCEDTKITNMVNALTRRATAEVWKFSSSNSYVLYGAPWKETEVVSEDIPLCSFNRIKDVLQKEIDSGKMKEIYTIKLGYVIFADREQEYKSGKSPWKDEQFLLVPTWIVECSYTENPDKIRTYPERESADAYDYRSCDWLYDQWMFNAQTGERYYSNSNSDSWCYAPSIIEW